jgi:uncharacterized repeat protein (TIGR01451 family)
MKFLYLLLFCLFGINSKINAQYVTIPDANFVTYLQSNFSGCMNGNQLDTTCSNILNYYSAELSNMGISDLTGIEYFDNLRSLYCDNNNLTFLPRLPNLLELLNCDFNNLTSLPNLPNSIVDLFCANNQLIDLPDLPNMMTTFSCYNNSLSSIPILPDGLIVFACDSNPISDLPNLPQSLQALYFSNTNVSVFPNLPNQITTVQCSDCNISCFPIFSENISDLYITGNPFTCLPNYIPAMSSELLAYPLCIENDFINNPSGCNPNKGIRGSIFNDSNLNCEFETTENKIYNTPIKIYDESNELIGMSSSNTNGDYHFSNDNGIFTVMIDTLNKPYSAQCQFPGNDSTFTVALNATISNVNFPVTCKPGFDLGVQSALTNGWVFPGQNHDLKIIAGDLSQWYNMNCASGIGGEVQISVSGPVTYQNPSNEALTPTVSGNVYNYSIPDFGDINIQNAFGLIFKTDTTAQAGDQICISIIVTPTNGDNNMSNNTFEYCYQVVNSYDPNMKEVYPVNVEPGYDDYFNYTIHFQNTGSAPAFNIRLLDTLDTNLDLETFQVINFSHYNTALLSNSRLTFHFPNIMLADSTSDLEGSKGFVQYRIKPKANLALGTQIKNTAYIYFDFNAPIITNTTINEYVETNSISEKESSIVRVFPNPFSTITTIAFKNSLTDADIKLYNVYGQEVRSITDFSGDKLKIERENLANGIYYLKVGNDNRTSETVRLILKD